MQPLCEQRFEKDLDQMLKKAFTIQDVIEAKAVCILDTIPLPFKTFQRDQDFLVWSQKSLTSVQFILASILRLESMKTQKKSKQEDTEVSNNGNSTNNTINNELKAAKIWYEEFSSKFPNADVYEHILRFQLQDYIMDFPVMVYDHISHFPNLSFDKKLELMCSLNFSACRIFLSSLWNHKKISPCTDTDPHGVIHFHASWQQPLYKKVLNKADETSFGIKLMDAYQKPIYKLMDHYNFWILMDAVEFPI